MWLTWFNIIWIEQQLKKEIQARIKNKKKGGIEKMVMSETAGRVVSTGVKYLSIAGKTGKQNDKENM